MDSGRVGDLCERLGRWLFSSSPVATVFAAPPTLVAMCPGLSPVCTAHTPARTRLSHAVAATRQKACHVACNADCRAPSLLIRPFLPRTCRTRPRVEVRGRHAPPPSHSTGSRQGHPESASSAHGCWVPGVTIAVLRASMSSLERQALQRPVVPRSLQPPPPGIFRSRDSVEDLLAPAAIG